MSIDELKKEIEKLNLSEKLFLVEGIWDSITRSNAILPLHEWQKTELDKRNEEFKNGQQTLHNWNEVHDGLRAKYK
jgi:putative addiction module component (TIGR02574 family)